jgi:hypothetical protein
MGTGKSLGVTTDPTKSGSVADLSKATNSNLHLYFYVGETTRDTGLINASQIASTFADKIGRTECKAYITETYVNGTSWYRVYSDGWKEQGGLSSTFGVNANTTVTLLKPFLNTQYTVVCSPWTSAGYSPTGNPHTITTTSFMIHNASNDNKGGSFACSWYACGY